MDALGGGPSIHPWLAVSLVGLLLSAGCVGPELAERSLEPSSTEPTSALNLSLSLERLAAGAEWTAVRVSAQENTSVRMEIDADWTLGEVGGPRHACSIVSAGEEAPTPTVLTPETYPWFPGHASTLQPSAEVGVGQIAAWARPPTVEAGWSMGASVSQLVGPGDPVTFLVGHDDPEAWQEHGAFSVDLTSEEPVHVETVAEGRIECLAWMDGFDEGTWARSNAETIVRDAVRSFEVGAEGTVWVDIVSDIAHDARVRQGSDTLWASTHDDANGAHDQAYLCSQSPEEIELQVPRLDGIERPQAYVHALALVPTEAQPGALGCDGT